MPSDGFANIDSLYILVIIADFVALQFQEHTETRSKTTADAFSSSDQWKHIQIARSWTTLQKEIKKGRKPKKIKKRRGN